MVTHEDPILIVDEHDNPIDAVSKEEAWQKGLIHRIVRVMVENKDGKILLQKRTAKLTWPHCWDNSAAGHVDKGEDYLVAAKRELAEEIGVKDAELQEVDTYYTETSQSWGTLKRFNRVYKLVIDYTPQDLQPSEVVEVRWFTLKEVKDLLENQPDKITDGLYDVISRYY